MGGGDGIEPVYARPLQSLLKLAGDGQRTTQPNQRVATMRSNYVRIPRQFASSPTAAFINQLLQARPAVPVRRGFRGRPQQCRRQRKAPACYRGMMPPGAKRYAKNNTSTSAPPMSNTLFLSIASSPFCRILA